MMLVAKFARNQLLGASSLGRHNSTRVDGGRKVSRFSAIKMSLKARTVVGRGGCRLCHPGSELRQREREKG